MVKAIKRAWKHFSAKEPGSRFLETFEENQRERGSAWKRVALIVAGVLLILVGVVALVAPGPGLLIGGVGLALIARESKLLSRALDRFELQVRRLWSRLRRKATPRRDR